MDGKRFDGLTRRRFGVVSGGAAVAVLGLAGRDGEAAKRKKKGGFCKASGQKCNIPGKSCKKTFCLNAPFTIEATWSVAADHDTYLFVPPEHESTGPAPYIKYFCTEENSLCVDVYPFACVNDQITLSSEITTVYRRLKGEYEYWIELGSTTLAAELTIALKDSGGRVVRQWENPANPLATRRGWHVFDIDGSNGSIVSIDTLFNDFMPRVAHDPSTNVCPD